MPELPEVETIRRGLDPILTGNIVTRVVARRLDLRYPIPPLDRLLPEQILHRIERKSRYLIFNFARGTLIVHLGMSGSLRLYEQAEDPFPDPQPHDHIDIMWKNGALLRYNDPRRFGFFLWVDADGSLADFISLPGIEPLTPRFSGKRLHRLAATKNISIKQLIMNDQLIAGVGNIYANEALWIAQIHPGRRCHSLTENQCDQLVASIKTCLRRAIRAGGTTLRNYSNQAGRPGYFARQLDVYGRAGLSCNRCGETIVRITHAGRSSFVCPGCQRL